MNRSIDRERAPVARLVLSMGDEQREYPNCEIVVDHHERVVHVWTGRGSDPAVTAPLEATRIDWRLPEPPAL